MSTRLWSLLDQVFFSAANFVLVVCFARYYSDVEVSGYGIGLSIALIIQSTQRSCYVVQNAVLAPHIFRKRARAVLGLHLTAWAWILAVEFVFAAILWALNPGVYAHAIILSTLVCSLIYAQLDFDRIVLAKYGRTHDALAASVLFFVLAILLFFTIQPWHIDFSTTLLLVGGTAAFKIARLATIVGWPDLVLGSRLAKRAMRRYLVSSILGVAGYTGHSHGPLFILGYMAPASHSAAFVALRGLMQPLMVIVRSLDIIDKSLMQSENGKSLPVLREAMLKQMVVYALLSLCALLGSMLLGKFIVGLVYHERYEGFDHLLTGWAWIFSMLAITLPVETVIVKLGRINRYNHLRLLAGVVGMILAFMLCPQMGASGAIYASIGGWLVCVAVATWLIRDVLMAKN